MVRKYPAELLVVSLYNFCVAIYAAPVTFFLEKDTSAWKISSNMMLYAILYAVSTYLVSFLSVTYENGNFQL